MSKNSDQDTVSRTDKIIADLRNNKYLAPFIAIGIGLVALAVLTDSITSIQQFFGLSPGPMTTVTFSESDFNREANPRFLFSFLYPKTWDRFDPENGDGNRYRDPKNSDIHCSFSGSHAVLSSSLEESVDWSLAQAAKEPGFEMITNVESGRHQVSWTEIDGKVQEFRKQIEGRRVVYRSKPEGNTSLISMELFLYTGDREIHALCQAPESLFPAYEPLFLTLLAEVRVLQDDQ